MADRFVNLQRELRRVKNDIEGAFGTLLGGMQRDRLLANFGSMIQQPQLLDQLVSPI